MNRQTFPKSPRKRRKSHHSYYVRHECQYYASHTKTMLPTRKYVTRSSRQPDHTKTSKLHWYGYVCRLSGLAKTILQGTVRGGRKQGRQKTRWEDNIREWTGLEFAKSQRAS